MPQILSYGLKNVTTEALVLKRMSVLLKNSNVIFVEKL